MKLLIYTQKVDRTDDNLGFFHRWLEVFATHVESLTVICLYEGQHDLPKNVRVLSLGKERHQSRVQYIFRFYKYMWQERQEYDAVFVHMNEIYVLLGGLLWRLWGKRIALWYVHKSVTWTLRVAAMLVHIIFTASEKSFRLQSKKIHITGHGIDVDYFVSTPQAAKKTGTPYRILSVGRIATSKNIDLIVDVAEKLQERSFNFTMTLVGSSITSDDTLYEKEIHERVQKLGLADTIRFVGSVQHHNIRDYYFDADMFINLSDTGSVDKVVLEAMASGLAVVVSNEAFVDILPQKYVVSKDANEIAQRIAILSKENVDSSLREYVEKHHDLSHLIGRIVMTLD